MSNKKEKKIKILYIERMPSKSGLPRPIVEEAYKDEKDLEEHDIPRIESPTPSKLEEKPSYPVREEYHSMGEEFVIKTEPVPPPEPLNKAETSLEKTSTIEPLLGGGGEETVKPVRTSDTSKTSSRYSLPHPIDTVRGEPLLPTVKKPVEDIVSFKRRLSSREKVERASELNDLLKILDEIEQVVIGQPPGIMFDQYEEARRLLEKARKALIEDYLDDAKKAIKDARIALKPHIDYFLDRANRFQSNGTKLAQEGKYEEAVTALMSALDSVREALNLARRRRLQEYVDKLRKREFIIESLIYTIKISQVENKIRNAVNPKEVEDALRELEKIKPPTSIVEELRYDVMYEAYSRIIRIRLNTLISMIKDAAEKYRNGELFQAKQILIKVKRQVDKIREDAEKYGLTEEIKYINELERICNNNIRGLTEMLISMEPPRGWSFAVPTKELAIQVIKEEETPLSEVVFSGISRLDKISDKYIYDAEKDLLGEGAFAWVYRARRRKDGELVALKIFKEINKQTKSSLKREIETVSKLEHENIVRIYNWDPQLGYIEMELAETDLRKLLDKEKRIEPKRAARIIFEVARALDYAHRKGIIHRDVKPSNILLFVDKSIKLGDWGIAKALVTGRKRKSTTQKLMKALLYSSPEMLTDPDKVDHRSDIFQLGVVFYEAVTGINPFDADTEGAIVNKILNVNPPPPSYYNSKAKPFDHIIMKCLEKDPNKRYQSIRELRHDLAEAYERTYSEKLRFSASTEDKLQLISTNVILYLESYIDRGTDSRLGEEYLAKAIKYLEELYRETKDSQVGKIIKELEILATEKAITRETVQKIKLALRKWI